MMSRASRMLKWAGAITVLLAAAPIAYATPTPTRAPATGPQPSSGSSPWCGAGPQDYVGPYRLAGLTNAGHRFDLASMPVTVDGLTYASKPGTTACADPNSAALVTEFSAGTPDGSDTLTPQRR